MPATGALHAHAGVQEAEGAAADRGHGRGTVDSRISRHDADRVGKVFLLRQDHADGPLGQVAVADLAPPGRSEPADFPDGERGEVVVHHEVLPRVPVDIVHDLFVQRRSQRRDDQCLGLTAREQRRPMGAGQDVDFARDRADFRRGATVGPDVPFPRWTPA